MRELSAGKVIGMGKLIDTTQLLARFGVSERFNADIPAYVIGIIKGMPEGVTRCKDCRWSNGFNYCLWFNIIVSDEDYCSRGERKDEQNRHNGA